LELPLATNIKPMTGSKTNMGSLNGTSKEVFDVK